MIFLRKVQKLRVALKERNLPVKGRKSSLIERLINSMKLEHGITKDFRITLTRIHPEQISSSNASKAVVIDDEKNATEERTMTLPMVEKKMGKAARNDDVNKEKETGIKPMMRSKAKIKQAEFQQNSKKQSKMVRNDDQKEDVRQKPITRSMSKLGQEKSEQINENSNKMLRSDDEEKDARQKPVTQSMSKIVRNDNKTGKHPQIGKPIKRKLESICEGDVEKGKPKAKKRKINALCLKPSLKKFEMVLAHVKGKDIRSA